MDAERVAWVRLEGRLTDLQAQAADAGADKVEAVTATVVGDRGRYGDAWHVTFPAGRDLDLWIVAIAQASAEAATQRATPTRARPAGIPPRPAPPDPLRIILWGELRCGPPVPPAGARLATILVDHAQFPRLPAETLARAETLWRRSQHARRTRRET